MKVSLRDKLILSPQGIPLLFIIKFSVFSFQFSFILTAVP